MSGLPHTSDILTELAGADGDRLSVMEILLALKTRAFALLIVVLGLPNCLPMPPPIPLMCGFLLLAVSIQMIAGLEVPWFPARIARQSVARSDIQRAVARSLPVVLRLEHLSRQRLVFFDGKLASRLVGVVLLILSVGLILAAPFVGQIPMGVAICLVGLGLVERDGVIFLVGVVVGLFGLTLSVGFVLTLITGIGHLLG